MIKKLCSLAILSIVAFSSFLSAAIEYEIHDIGTLQTRSSQAIALNNQGQILGWYNIDGSNSGKHFFVRDRDESFYELPNKENGVGWEINWRYLTNDGKAYGTFDGNASFAVLYMWDQKNGVVKLGNLPGKEISAINDAGQVLIKFVEDRENGQVNLHPVIWDNGKITKLKGLQGNTGIPSAESYGLDMNNKGEVVGKSLTYVVYKNEIYKKFHAVKWVNGQAIDLHNSLPKSEQTQALAINDRGDVLYDVNNFPCLFKSDGSNTVFYVWPKKINNIGHVCHDYFVFSENREELTSVDALTRFVQSDPTSLWSVVPKIVSINDKDEIIALGKTIYGEEHAMLLIPRLKSK